MLVEYRVAFYCHTDCRAEEFVKARNQRHAYDLAVKKDRVVYRNWCNQQDFYVIIERTFRD